MEFNDQEDHEEEMEMTANYDSLGNSAGGRVKMSSSGPDGLALAAAAAAATQQQQQPRKVVRYRECLKNHAVGIGGHALDGCCKFLAAGPEGTLDALKCAACNCHRNFHRKEGDPPGHGLGVITDACGQLVPHHGQQHHPQFSPYYRTPAGFLHVAAHHRLLALPSTSGGGGTHSGGQEQDDDVSNPSGGGGGGSGGLGMGMGMHGTASSGKKRFRTKFSQEQKERMLSLAERLGWRIQKQDEPAVQQFCNETGVNRHVLKVWMHNNKHTLAIWRRICLKRFN
nr:zinc-finger homeodomain protein 1-like isoform X2 [Malus domestica]